MRAPEILASQWMGTPAPLAAQRGKVVALHAFQLLCPGCVLHGLPQAIRLHERFAPELVVIGIHSVFEHHDAMTPRVLEAFLYEQRVPFSVAVDEPTPGQSIPKTMAAYQFRGTPSLVLIDREGQVREHWFGRPSDLDVGAAVGALLASERTQVKASEPAQDAAGCDDQGCQLPAK